ncbi:type I-E CRISPR-associated protein Cas7/Cse4/CasC [Janibacter sp. GXQ6167]|uniref:type I-E CRISPR-associated protein Cas7/Cse4/CasC n=1 Tax=Janibacter sp. GXQ6167 TaxID=3240791 RepID=UPI0035246B83
MEAAWAMPEPGLMVIEAPMGEGKTEAALAAAEVLAHRFGCGGVFFGLPTQATTDAMFGRILKWIDHLPTDDLHVGASLALIHSKAKLNPQLSELRGGPASRGIDIDSGERGRDRAEVASRAMVHSWMQGRKKAVLASIVIATVDHLLFGALRSRHLALRMVGLMGKVVIVDEVHAYDTWMSTYLHRALEWLASVGTPVILLSATLPSRQRRELVEAYTGNSAGEDSPSETGYPRITTATSAGSEVVVPDPANEPVEVRIEMGGFGGDAEVVALIEEVADRQGCVLVVRNTVRRAQATARVLRDVFGPDVVTVSHSQFLAVDRARKDRELLSRFGPPGASTRPPFHIVVATQVVEQSLDVDFDLLITDIAPMDLILQRCGRLHRHERERPPRLRTPRCIVVGYSIETLDFPGSERVYGRRALLASLAVIEAKGSVVLFPQDIPGMVDLAYGEPPIPPGWHEAWREATERASKEQEQARVNSRTFCIAPPDHRSISGWGSATVGDPESDSRALAAVRDIDPTLEVIVVVADGDTWRTPDWIGEGAGLVVPQDRPPSSTRRRRSVCVSLGVGSTTTFRPSRPRRSDMALFIELHALQTVPPSNINRDDTGSPKTAIYGGSRRARVSSQAWKRAIRVDFERRLDPAASGVRTKRVPALLRDAIVAIDPALSDRAGTLAETAVEAAGLKLEKSRRKDVADDALRETGYLVFLSRRQIARMAEMVVANRDESDLAKALKSAGIRRVADQDHSFDIALFGRMVADQADLTVDAAAQVAHAISVHAVDNEFDYFTAVDDQNSEEETGAGMIGTVEFNSSTLYRYATVNVDGLYENLGDAGATAAAVEAFIESFVRSIPTGKQNTFAHGTLPQAVVITARTTQPINLVQAFERAVVPVGEASRVEVAAKRLVETSVGIESAYGEAPERVWVVRSSDDAAPLDSLAAPSRLSDAASDVRDLVVQTLNADVADHD